MKLFIWHNKISNIEQSEQRILQVLLSNYNCCSYKTFSRNFRISLQYFHISQFCKKKIRKISLHLLSRKNVKFCENSLQNATKNFRIFCEKFLLLETLAFLFWPKPDMFTVWNFLPLYVYFGLEIVLHCTCFLTMDKVEIFTTVHVHCTNAGGK